MSIDLLVVITQILIFFFAPAYLIRLSRTLKADRVLSDIVICYGIGMILGNTKFLWLHGWSGDENLQETITSIANTTQTTAQLSAFISVQFCSPCQCC